ncbi:MAG: polysaccharide deacetylase family protein [Taibaiella sp.]|nr:polysaccharide deacetylase family protein [Taibaiella sp.]
MDELVVYSTVSNPRIIYVLDWLLKERLQIPYRLEIAGADGRSQRQEAGTGSSFEGQTAERSAHTIYYGVAMPGALCIPASGLLSQTGLKNQIPPTGEWRDVPTLFAIDGSSFSVPFDLFAAIFYLLSRYEEYNSNAKDKHDRYPATDSVLYRNGWLQRPIVDEWVHAFRQELERTLQVKLPPPVFSFCATYDIDIAYSHLHKGVGRIAGAFLRALLHADLKQVSQRSRVLRKKQKDPYDSFRWMRQIHKEYGVSPTYFVLAALHTTRFDKNIHPQHPAMVRVIKNIAKEGKLGIHPSYHSQEGDTLQQERKVVEQIAGHGTTLSRQHYIRAVLPHTYRALIGHGITDDYSMGYGTHLGFRAGTGCPFYWYDLEKEQVTALRVHPFCFMDTTAHYEARLEAQQAFERLEAMTEVLRRTGSVLVTVFHNFSLGTADEWNGWRQAYELFLHTTIRAGIGSMKVPANR